VNLQKKDQGFTPSPTLTLFSRSILSFKDNLNLYPQESTYYRYFEGKVLNKAPEDLANDYVA
jgi:hypothetical protein